MCQNALQVISNLIISSIGYCDYCTGRRLEFLNYLSERFISIFFNMLDSWKWHFWSLLTLKFLCKSACSKSACPTSFWRPLMLETRGKLLPPPLWAYPLCTCSDICDNLHLHSRCMCGLAFPAEVLQMSAFSQAIWKAWVIR